MYAVVKTGGKQYRVAPGDTFRVEKLEAEQGSKVALDNVLMVIDGDKTSVGSPELNGVKVMCTVLEQGRAKKIHVMRYKAKKNVRVKKGHRQYYSRLRVDSIEA